MFRSGIPPDNITLSNYIQAHASGMAADVSAGERDADGPSMVLRPLSMLSKMASAGAKVYDLHYIPLVKLALLQACAGAECAKLDARQLFDRLPEDGVNLTNELSVLFAQVSV